MATIAGGGTIATIGLTATENTTVSTILQNNFPTITSTTDVTVTSTPNQIVATDVLFGTFQATAVQNQTISTPASGGVAVVNADKSGSGTGNSITNLVLDSNVGGLILSGSGSPNTLTGIILGGTPTSLVVGNSGSQIIDGSQSTKNLTVVSGTGNDTIVSGTGNDSVTLGEFGVANGGGGADTLIGGSGSATLGGGAGADSIVAATGGGVLIGEVGNDTMVGGAGKDIFVYTSGGGNDVINGFDPANDTLGLANFSDLSAAGWSILDVINRATVSGGNTIISMPDGSTITVAGVTGINVNWFGVK